MMARAMNASGMVEAGLQKAVKKTASPKFLNQKSVRKSELRQMNDR
jgi:hypothetical protein